MEALDIFKVLTPFIILLFSYSLGQRLILFFNEKKWLREKQLESKLKKIEAFDSLIDEISKLVSERLYKMKLLKLHFDESVDDNAPLNEARKDYRDVKNRWNSLLTHYYHSLNQLESNHLSTQLEKDIQKNFVKLHNQINFWLKNKNNLQNNFDNIIADLEKNNDSFLKEASKQRKIWSEDLYNNKQSFLQKNKDLITNYVKKPHYIFELQETSLLGIIRFLISRKF